MTLYLCEIVVTVDPLSREVVRRSSRRTEDGTNHDGDDAVHHFIAIETRKLLRPEQVADVRLELRCPFVQEGKVAIGEWRAAGGCLLLRFFDVEIANLVADPARTGMESQPHGVLFVGRKLDEMIA